MFRVLDHKSAPLSRRGIRIGRNESYKPPVAPKTLEDLRETPTTDVFEANLLFRKKEHNPYLFTLVILLKSPATGEFFTVSGVDGWMESQEK